MKRYLVGGLAAFCLTCGAALAGGIAPAVTPDVVMADTSSSASQQIIVPLFLLLFVAAAMSGSD